MPRIPKDISAPDARCRCLSLSRILPGEGPGPQAAISASKTYQKRALSCIPRAERAASPPAAPAPPCARGGARLLLAQRSGSAPAVINVPVKRRLKPPQPLPDTAPSCPSCYLRLCRLSLEVLLPADSSGRPPCPEEGPCITLRAAALPFCCPGLSPSDTKRRDPSASCLMKLCCKFSVCGVFSPQTVFCGKGTALKQGMLCNGALCPLHPNLCEQLNPNGQGQGE